MSDGATTVAGKDLESALEGVEPQKQQVEEPVKDDGQKDAAPAAKGSASWGRGIRQDIKDTIW